MPNEQLPMKDKPTVTVNTATDPERKVYEVTAEKGLFKNGKTYAKGSKIRLDEKTAKAFLNLKEIKAV